MNHSPVDRLLDRVLVGDGCWEWDGAHIPEGYASIEVGGRQVGVHVLMYEAFVGLIPAGEEVDHLCRNTGCVRPSHLESVTHQENLRRGNSPVGINARREECASSHPFTPENTYIRANGNRTCRECVRQANRAWRAKRKAAA